ncbi:MAG: aspartate--tRNA ligase [Candidatus Gracilibacteria bacterium]|nr:aspartate--tRNA ligase [Candidatus Gracilibacteria bacterium]
MLRTITCNELTKENVGQEVTLCGWVSNRRDHGGIIFIDLRDRYGITQVVFDPEDDKQSWLEANDFRSEFVVQVTGKVRNRPDGQSNPNLKTGDIEVIIKNTRLLSKSKTPPFELDDFGDLAGEDIRYKYRYIDLRRRKALENVTFRSNFLNFTRNWFASNEFLEVQTPIFTVSSPEGARDFLVPSRIHPGKFYALPQAPQQYKQLLMVGGIDKYFQIAPCFRDEDPRADRHACEFYQIDAEMSFVEQADVFNVVETYIKDVVNAVSKKEVLGDFNILSYDEALENYGSDKPDLRFGMKFVDLTDIFKNSDFSVFKNVCDTNGVIKAIKLEGQTMSRKDIDDLTQVAIKAGAKGLAYIIYDAVEGPKSPILKFFSDAEMKEMESRLEPKTGDIIFFSANEFKRAVGVLSVVRLALRDKFNLADNDKLSFAWIVDFPMFEQDEVTGKLDFCHNPFSMPHGGVEAFERQDLLNIKAIQYDLACNGYEILSGSIRNHDVESLVKAFSIVGRDKQEVMDKFGAMYEAFQYGVPPHGGFAIGMDRFMMILKDEENIREVYAFPKSGKAQDVMMNAPSIIDQSQLDELHIEIKQIEL